MTARTISTFRAAAGRPTSPSSRTHLRRRATKSVCAEPRSRGRSGTARAWIEEIEADGPGGHWEAANVFLYDPVAGQWSENYVDSSDGKMDRPSVGGYRDGKLEFYSIQPVGGQSVLVRGTWEITSADQHSYAVARSIDGGRTWHTSFIARVSRSR